jgi:membrane associated rhomboid family serine protease
MTRRQCTVCGKPALYRCKYCGDTLCREHLHPELHWCMGLELYQKDREAQGTAAFPAEPEPKGEPRGVRIKSPLRSLTGNYSLILMLLITLSFLLQLLIPGYTDRFMLVPSQVMERPWTLVTHIFLHGSFEHFFFNMLFFVFFGPFLERKIGSTKFLLIFFLSGIVAGIGWSLTAVNPALGASGALSGIFATLAVLMPRLRVYLFFFIPLEMWMAVILFALIDFVMIGSGDMIAHTAHLSGLCFGLLAGVSLKRTSADT